MPGVESAEITLAIEAIAEAQGRDSPLHHGQGFRINKLEQRAVERHAVDLATAHWQSLGWTVHDVGATKSYDLHCTRGDAVLYVEVKGTTSTGDKILLTRNEVALHRDTYPDNALVVVSQISLNRDAEAPSASGGQIHVLAPWELDTERLSPIAYEFTVGRIS
ncbi:protein NO VEIN domain-containing protein [Microbacterium sp. MC2]